MPLVSGPDVIGRARHSLLQREQDCAAMIVNVDPIAHIAAISINRNRFVMESVRKHERKKLFRKLARAIIVSATCNHGVEAESMMSRPHQMLGSRLGGRVWAVGCE